MPGRLGADVGGLRGEVKRYPCIEACLSCFAGSEKTLAGRIECLVKSSQKSKGTLGEDLCLRILGNLSVDFYASSHVFRGER